MSPELSAADRQPHRRPRRSAEVVEAISAPGTPSSARRLSRCDCAAGPSRCRCAHRSQLAPLISPERKPGSGARRRDLGALRSGPGRPHRIHVVNPPPVPTGRRGVTDPARRALKVRRRTALCRRRRAARPKSRYRQRQRGNRASLCGWRYACGTASAALPSPSKPRRARHVSLLAVGAALPSDRSSRANARIAILSCGGP